MNVHRHENLLECSLDALLWHAQEVHPDRGGDQERFARMGTIANILRDAEKRKR